MNRPRSGFSLVELMIVVAILGLLAAVAIPQLTDPEDETREAALVAAVSALRTAVDSYWSQHDGLPGQGGADQFASQLCRPTDRDGVPGVSETHTLGPYLDDGRVPVNPVTGTNTVFVVDSMPVGPSGAAAWLYDRRSGEVRANVRGTAPSGTRYFDL